MSKVAYKTFKDYLGSLNSTLSIKNIDGVKYYFLKKAIKAKIEDGEYYIASLV